jgi:hypothetical protein
MEKYDEHYPIEKLPLILLAGVSIEIDFHKHLITDRFTQINTQ